MGVMYKKIHIFMLLIFILTACSVKQYTFEDYQKKINSICDKELSDLKIVTEKKITSSKEFAENIKASFEVYSKLANKISLVENPKGYTTSKEELVKNLEDSAKSVEKFNKGISKSSKSVATLIDYIGNNLPSDNLSFRAKVKSLDFKSCVNLSDYLETVGVNHPIDDDIFKIDKGETAIETGSKVCKIILENARLVFSSEDVVHTTKEVETRLEKFSLILISAQIRLSEVEPPSDIIDLWQNYVYQFGQLAFQLSKYQNLLKNNVDDSVLKEAKASLTDVAQKFDSYVKQLNISC